MRLVLAAVGLALLVPGSAFAKNLIVDGDNTAGTSMTCGAESSGQPGQSANPCATIQKAVDQTTSGDVVLVRQRRSGATYPESVNVASPHGGITITGVPCVSTQASPCNAPNPDPQRPIVDPPNTTTSIGTPGFNVTTTNVTIDKFVVQDATGASSGGACGIRLSTGATGSSVTGSLLRGNTIGLCEEASGVNQANPVKITGNAIQNNNVAGSGSGNGIYSDTGVSHVLIDGNAFGTAASTTANQNGTVLFAEGGGSSGDVNITNNTSNGDGAYRLTRITGGSFTGNTVLNAGAASLALDSINGGSAGVFLYDDHNLSIEQNTIDNATFSAIRLQGNAGPGDSASSGLTIQGNLLTDSTDYALFANGGQDTSPPVSDAMTIHENRIVGNGAGGLRVVDNTSFPSTPITQAQDNYFGCNEGPNTMHCDTATGNLDASPWLVLTLTASPTVVTVPGGSQLTVDFNHRSNGGQAATPSLFPTSAVRLANTGPAGSTFGTCASPSNPTGCSSLGAGPITVLTTGGAKSVFLRSANTGTATVVADDLDLTPAGTQPDDDAVASATATVQFKPLDSDSDGVPNSTDQCPTVAGPASNHGCPPDVRKTPAGLTLDLAPDADTHSPYTYTAKGKLQRPTGVSKADGCQGVIITRFRYKGTVVATNFNELNGSCKYKNTASFSSSKLPGKGQLKVRSSFGGNDVLKKITSPKRTVGFGH